MKKVGLVAAKGEGKRIDYCLRALSRIVDEIVYLDDNSPDDTLERVRALEDQCRVSRIIESKRTDRHEGKDRQVLLEAGREIGGQAFLVLDADEAFAADADEYIKAALDMLEPGDALSAVWTHLWRSAGEYRVDPCTWVNNRKEVAFCDDGVTDYNQQVYLHSARVPQPKRIHLLPPEIVLLHFQFVFWPNVEVKQTWYKVLEFQRGDFTKDYLNWAYGRALDETGLQVAPSRAAWFYPFFDESAFMRICSWRLVELRRWIAAKPPNHFKGLLDACPYINQTAFAAVVKERGGVDDGGVEPLPQVPVAGKPVKNS